MSTFLKNQEKLDRANYKQKEIDHVDYLKNQIQKVYNNLKSDVKVSPGDVESLLSMLAESNSKLRNKLEEEFNEIWK